MKEKRGYVVMKCSARVNNLKIIFSGAAMLCHKDDVFTVTIDPEVGKVLTLQMNFIDDDSQKGQTIKTRIDGDVAKITCINFKDPFGTGLKEPVDIATILGKKVYIMFWSYSMGDSSKKIEYFFLMEE